MAAVEIHRSNLAGTWYPADPIRLREAVEEFVAAAHATPDERVRAMIVPHAGYRYSGRAAGAAYARLPRRRWRRAAVLAPSHYHAFEGAAVFAGSGFETPLGVVEVDSPGVDDVLAVPEFFSSDAPYAREHSLEIQLPFLQVVDPELRLVPVLIGGGARLASLAALAPGLRALDDGETLFVVSSDFTHYGASFDYLPFSPAGAKPVSEALRRLDQGAIERVTNTDVSAFEQYVEETGITVCGRAPIAAFLRSTAAGLAGELVCYYTSLDVTGDYEHSVSYAAIVFRPRSS